MHTTTVGEGSRSGVLWITGFSGSGKTTVARLAESALRRQGERVILLDGDDLRSIFAGRWGYEREDRVELAHVYFRLCSHLASQGFVVIISAVAMYEEVRQWIRTNVPRSCFVYLDVPRDVRLERDAATKNVYGKGTDLEDMYDRPESADVRIENFGATTPAVAAEQVVEGFLKNLGDDEADRGKGRHWDHYYAGISGVQPPSPFATTVETQLAPGSRVLEVGCGNGRDSSFLASSGHSVIGLDPSEAAIALCSRTHRQASASFVAGVVPDYAEGWKDEFDAIYSRFVVHAMTEAEEVALWAEARKVLRPGGKLFVECRSINDPLARQGEVLSPTERIAGHYRRFIVLEELLERLSHAGFVVEEAIESNGLAVHGDEDPVVIRILASHD